MIPKVIHYCWFGRNPLPESAVKTLKDILQDNQDRPQTIRVYFAGIG